MTGADRTAGRYSTHYGGDWPARYYGTRSTPYPEPSANVIHPVTLDCGHVAHYRAPLPQPGKFAYCPRCHTMTTVANDP